MALFTRLQTLCTFGRCFRFNPVSKNKFHSLIRSPKCSPQPGTRSFFLKIFTKPSQSNLKEADDIPDGFMMIYRNTMSKYILGAQIISGVTGGVVLMSLLFKSAQRDPRRETVEWSSTAKPAENEEVVYITIFIALLVLVQMMVSRTPIRIYKVPKTNKYIAINYGRYFFGKERLSFYSGEMSRVKPGGILPWKENRYLIQTKTDRRPILLVEYFFRRPADLSIMLREQQDPDLEEEGDVK